MVDEKVDKKADIKKRNAAVRRHMTVDPPAQASLIARIERALLLLAYFIERDGDVHVPMYEKFEKELAELKAVEDVKVRARQRLEDYKGSGDRKIFGLDEEFLPARARRTLKGLASRRPPLCVSD